MKENKKINKKIKSKQNSISSNLPTTKSFCKIGMRSMTTSLLLSMPERLHLNLKAVSQLIFSSTDENLYLSKPLLSTYQHTSLILSKKPIKSRKRKDKLMMRKSNR